MTSKRSRVAPAMAAALLLALGAAGPVFAQEPADKSKDEGLEKLLDKVGDTKKADEPARPDPPKPDAAKPKPDDADLEKLLDKAEQSAKTDKPAEPKKPGEVAPGDEGLDKLLEGVGQSKDKPTPEDRKPGGDPPPDGQPRPDQPRGDGLGGDDKKVDEKLEEMLGRKPKKEGNGQGQGQGQGGENQGPLGDLIKEMRDVEERLGKPDTGDETRQKQTVIVKKLDTLIEQIKNAPSSSQAMRMMRQGQQPGNRPGQQQGQQPGAMANGPPPSKPLDPKKPPAPFELAKEIWGQLPPQFRDDMTNVMNEHPLPNKVDLIRLYYLSLGKKSSDR